ncbi:MAG: membrane-bound lytic murein transglycosylase F [Cellvibrionaceae bacterium]|jgi:membrane-bound lytic murein transglycosylase F
MSTEKQDSIRSKGRPIYTLGGLLLCMMPFLLSSSSIPTLLERTIDQGFLPILSSNGPITYYEGPFGYTGFEYELAEAFAEDLGLELAIKDESSLGDMLNSVGSSAGLFAASGLSVTGKRQKSLQFSVPYMQVDQHVIYRRGSNRPRKVEDLIGLDIVVAAHSSHAELLQNLQLTFPDLQWREVDDLEQLDLLEMIHSGKADITIADSTAYTVNSNIYPRARRGFNLPGAKNIAWAFPKNGDDSLYKAANKFLVEYRDSGKLDELTSKYFDNDYLDVGGALTFSQHIDKRLPKWEELFRETAEEFELDWLFLAAISYQESHWNAKAKSFTGVRGLMMLTRNTAKDLGVKDRTDPEESIYGGAKYFIQRLESLPDRIQNPDRLWMALAAYNVGLGHLEDARILTEKQGGNPDSWADIKERLPLLSKKKYYSKTKHGYARGYEPVRYVENIRNYYNILVWHHESQQRRLALELQNEIEPVNFLRMKNGTLSQL